jgi:hypothetical protein
MTIRTLSTSRHATTDSRAWAVMSLGDVSEFAGVGGGAWHFRFRNLATRTEENFLLMGCGVGASAEVPTELLTSLGRIAIAAFDNFISRAANGATASYSPCTVRRAICFNDIVCARGAISSAQAGVAVVGYAAFGLNVMCEGAAAGPNLSANMSGHRPGICSSPAKAGRQDLAVHRHGADTGRRRQEGAAGQHGRRIEPRRDARGSNFATHRWRCPGAPGLSVLNIDPDNAAESYRQRVLAQMGAATARGTARPCASSCPAPAPRRSPRSTSSRIPAGRRRRCVRPHRLRHGTDGAHLRLLSLPKAWTGFLQGNDRGASCLGPHSGLKMQEVRFKAALDALSDPAQTTVILVTRPDKGAIAEAARTSGELA